MALSKKHHYTPNFILRGFANPAGQLWVLDKTSGRCWRKTGGADQRYDVFAENHYNAVVGSTANPDLAVEDHLQQVETDAAPVVSNLVNCVKAGLYPGLGFTSRKRLARFRWAQYLRTPWIRNQVADSEDARRYFQESVAKAKRLFSLAPGDIESLMGNEQDWIEDAAKMVVMADTGAQRAVRYMTEMSVDLLKTADGGDTHFITSDRACLISPIARPEGKVLMALTRDVMLQLSRPEESRGDIVILDAGAANTLNGQAVRAATRFVAGPSCDYLRGLWEELGPGT